MTLNEDLVRRARGFAATLSETVENLLAAFIEAAEAKDADLQRRIVADAAFVARHGSLADEFDTL
jgi:hypothetical protein